MMWHSAWLYGVHITCTEMAAVSCGTSHADAVSTPLWWIFKNALQKASHSCRITCEHSESAWEWRIVLYKSSHHHHHHHHIWCSLLICLSDFGPGYAFDPKLLTITEGDCVKWVWTTPPFVRGIQYSIIQTANDTSKETMEGGFAYPGPSSANGKLHLSCDQTSNKLRSKQKKVQMNAYLF